MAGGRILMRSAAVNTFSFYINIYREGYGYIQNANSNLTMCGDACPITAAFHRSDLSYADMRIVRIHNKQVSAISSDLVTSVINFSVSASPRSVQIFVAIRMLRLSFSFGILSSVDNTCRIPRLFSVVEFGNHNIGGNTTPCPFVLTLTSWLRKVEIMPIKTPNVIVTLLLNLSFYRVNIPISHTSGSPIMCLDNIACAQHSPLPVVWGHGKCLSHTGLKRCYAFGRYG